MKPGLDPGVFAEMSVRVTQDMCPHFDGRLVHPVYATWTMVHHFELVGRMVLAPHLEPHEEAVGAHISADHEGMAGIGAEVTLRATVESCSARRLVTAMTAHTDGRRIATGRFVQVIMNKQRLAELIAGQQPRAPGS